VYIKYIPFTCFTTLFNHLARNTNIPVHTFIFRVYQIYTLLYFKSSTCENTFDNCISYSYDNRNEPALVNGLAAVARHSSTSKSPSTRAAERKRRGSGKGLVLTKFCRNLARISPEFWIFAKSKNRTPTMPGRQHGRSLWYILTRQYRFLER